MEEEAGFSGAIGIVRGVVSTDDATCFGFAGDPVSGCRWPTSGCQGDVVAAIPAGIAAYAAASPLYLCTNPETTPSSSIC